MYKRQNISRHVIFKLLKFENRKTLAGCQRKCKHIHREKSEKNDHQLFTKYSVKLNTMTGIFKTLKDKTVKLESIPRENVSQSEREIKTFEQIKT